MDDESKRIKDEYVEFAVKVLGEAKSPMTLNRIWDEGCGKGYDKDINSNSSTPYFSLSRDLNKDARDNSESKIKIFERLSGVKGYDKIHYFLKSRSGEIKDYRKKYDKAKKTQKEASKKENLFKERSLHPLLARFVHENSAFAGSKRIFVKTIFHEQSKKTGFNKWTYPDLVGFSLLFENDWEENACDLSEKLSANLVTLYSFELKKSLEKKTYKEFFSQAVSNSSWAHESYLVAADIDLGDAQLIGELEFSSTSLGVGIIHLNLNNFDASKVLFPCRKSPQIDFGMINKLATLNSKFSNFIKNVNDAIKIREICNPEKKYDEIIAPYEAKSLCKKIVGK